MTGPLVAWATRQASSVDQYRDERLILYEQLVGTSVSSKLPVLEHGQKAGETGGSRMTQKGNAWLMAQ